MKTTALFISLFITMSVESIFAQPAHSERRNPRRIDRELPNRGGPIDRRPIAEPAVLAGEVALRGDSHLPGGDTHYINVSRRCRANDYRDGFSSVQVEAPYLNPTGRPNYDARIYSLEVTYLSPRGNTHSETIELYNEDFVLRGGEYSYWYRFAPGRPVCVKYIKN
ncbi:MAG: hypothetical protein R2827_03860 [Bdellovibrionales bacterium]